MHAFTALQCIFKELTLIVVTKVSSSKLTPNFIKTCVNGIRKFSSNLTHTRTTSTFVNNKGLSTESTYKIYVTSFLDLQMVSFSGYNENLNKIYLVLSQT